VNISDEHELLTSLGSNTFLAGLKLYFQQPDFHPNHMCKFHMACGHGSLWPIKLPTVFNLRITHPYQISASSILILLQLT